MFANSGSPDHSASKKIHNFTAVTYKKLTFTAVLSLSIIQIPASPYFLRSIENSRTLRL